MRLPKDFGKKAEGFYNKPLRLFAPYKVHLIALQSFVKTHDNGLAILDGCYESLEPSPAIGTKPVTRSFYGREHLFIPVVSFDGYNVVLIENFDSAHAITLINKPSHPSYPYIEDLAKDTAHNEVIHAFGLDQVKLLKLTVDGLQQYEKACLAVENFELLIKYKNFIDLMCDGDLKTISNE